MSLSPLAIDLFCGLGGWTEGLLAEGYRVVGFDIERHDYGDGAKYPAQLVLQDVLTMHGKQFRDAALIVASPPCQEYSYMAMPWTRAKQIAAEYRNGTRDVKQLTALFDACFRIQREAIEAAGHHIPLVVENVRGAQPWVGRSRWNFGSFHLWGDVPALMPMVKAPAKVGGIDFNGYGTPGYKGQAFNSTAEQRLREAVKVPSLRICDCGHTEDKHGFNPDQACDECSCINPVWVSKTVGRRTDVGKGARFTSRDCGDERKNGGDWFGSGSNCSLQRRASSKSRTRKAAAAHIAKIPIHLAQHIARAWKPLEQTA